MDDLVLDNYNHLMEMAETDVEYQHLVKLQQKNSERLQSLLERLDEEDVGTIVDYIGISSETNLRILELACFSMVFPPAP